MTTEKGFTNAHLTNDIFQEILSGWNSNASLVCWKPIDLPNSHGLLSYMADSETADDRITGLRAFRLTYTLPGSSNEHHKDIALKSKARGHEILDMLLGIISKMNDDELLENWKYFNNDIGLSNLEHRELQAMMLKDEKVQSIRPEVYWTVIDNEQTIFVFAMEYINKKNFSHIDSIDDMSIWTEGDIQDAIAGVSKLHARYYGKTAQLPTDLSKLIKPFNKDTMVKMKPLWKAFLNHHHTNICEIWDTEAHDILNAGINNIDKVFDIIDKSPVTLIHNDFNLRNLCLRRDSIPGKHRLCLYDWECVSLGPPQRDTAEFLLFVLPYNTDVTEWHKYVNMHLECITKEVVESEECDQHVIVNESLDFENFVKVFDMAVLDVMIHRLATYGTTHRISHLPYLERVVQNGIKYMQARRKCYAFLS